MTAITVDLGVARHADVVLGSRESSGVGGAFGGSLTFCVRRDRDARVFQEPKHFASLIVGGAQPSTLQALTGELDLTWDADHSVCLIEVGGVRRHDEAVARRHANVGCGFHGCEFGRLPSRWGCFHVDRRNLQGPAAAIRERQLGVLELHATVGVRHVPSRAEPEEQLAAFASVEFDRAQALGHSLLVGARRAVGGRFDLATAAQRDEHHGGEDHHRDCDCCARGFLPSHFFTLAGPHPRSLSLGDCRASSFDTLRTTLSDVEGSLGPQALFVAPEQLHSSALKSATLSSR